MTLAADQGRRRRRSSRRRSSSSSIMNILRRRPSQASLPALSLLCLGFLVTLLLFPTSAYADSCASFHDCASCTNSSFSCHYCAFDNQCHTIGSPYGCLTGVNCYGTQACVRTEPEPMPVPAPSGSVLIGLGIFLWTSLFCTSACFFMANEYVNHATVVRVEKDPNYQELQAFEEGEGGGGGGGDENTLGYHLLSGQAGREEGGGGGGGGGTAAALPSPPSQPAAAATETWDDWVPRIRTVERSRFISILAKLIRVCVCLTLAWLALVALGVLLYTPHYPEVNVCNNELDWGSIISGFEKLKLEADYQLLLSVYNPNRLDVMITTGQGIFKHDHEPIGQVELAPFTIKGGAITDVLVTLVFQPSVWKGLQLDIAFQTGSLMVMVDMNVAGKVIWNGMRFFPFAYSMNNYFIHVGKETTGGSRKLCNCTSW